MSGAIFNYLICFTTHIYHTMYEYASNDNIFGLSEFLGEETPAGQCFFGKVRLKKRSTRRALESAGALGNMFSVHIIIIVFLVSDFWPMSCLVSSPTDSPPRFKNCGVAIQ